MTTNQTHRPLSEIARARVSKREFRPEWIAAALAFKGRWDKARCKRQGYADWREALSCAWHQGWDDRETDGGLLRQFRNNYGHEWLRTQGAK